MTKQTREKRGSVFLTVFFVLMLLSLFYLVELGMKNNNNQVITKNEQANLGTQGENVKTFTQAAVRAGVLRGVFLTSLNGIGTINGYWISYGSDDSPNLDDEKKELSTKIMQSCNNYLVQLYNLKIPGIKVNKSGFVERVNISINASLFTNKKYLKSISNVFNLSIEGSPAELDSLISSDKRIIPIRFTESIYPIRFWYFYKTLKDWARKNVLTETTCETEEVVQGVGGSSCRGPSVSNKTPEEIMKLALKNLTDELNKNGNYFTCSFNVPCAYAKTNFICCCGSQNCPSGDLTPGGSDCSIVIKKCSVPCQILNPFECHGVCPGFGKKEECLVKDSYCHSSSCSNNPLDFTGHFEELTVNDIDFVPLEHKSKKNKCDEPEPRCSQVTVKYNPMNPRTQYYVRDPCGQVCMARTGTPCHGFGENHTLEFVADVVCRDHKYSLPVSKDGLSNLTFRFKVHVFLNHWVPPPPPPSTQCVVMKVPCPKKCNCKKNPGGKVGPTPPNGNPVTPPAPPSPPPPPPPPPSGNVNFGG